MRMTPNGCVVPPRTASFPAAGRGAAAGGVREILLPDEYPGMVPVEPHPRTSPVAPPSGRFPRRRPGHRETRAHPCATMALGDQPPDGPGRPDATGARRRDAVWWAATPHSVPARRLTAAPLPPPTAR